jgi:general secretion pathway protein A
VPPAVTVCESGVVEIEKSGLAAGMTVRKSGAACVIDPLVAETVSDAVPEWCRVARRDCQTCAPSLAVADFMTEVAQPIPCTLPLRRGDVRTPQNPKPQLITGLRPELLFERYGIRENPFGVSPNPHYLYESGTHAEARSSLIAGIQFGVGFQSLIAPPGMGKTTILLSVLEFFKDVSRTVFLFQTQGDSRDFLRYLLLDLDCDAHDSDIVCMQHAFNRLLIREHHAGRGTIIVIDEAQSLDVSVLETVRLLSNFETRNKKLLQIILAGQPQLAQRLATPELAQLFQRISIRTTLIPFDLQDTRNYIEHRLRIAGHQGQPLFTPQAVKLIWERSRGIPRDINTLCFNALLLARAAEEPQIDGTILQEVVADRDLDLPGLISDMPTTASEKQMQEIEDISHLATLASTDPVRKATLQQSAARPQVPSREPGVGKSLEEQKQKHEAATGVIASDARMAEPTAFRLEPQAAHVANLPEVAFPPIRRETTGAQATRQLQPTVVENQRRLRPWRSFSVISVPPLLAALLVALITIHGNTPRVRGLGSQVRASTSPGGAPTAPTAAKNREGPALVTAIRYSSTTAATTVAIDLERGVKFESYRLASPERVYVDLQDTQLAPNFHSKSLKLSELAVSKMRVAEHQREVTRIALETRGFCEYRTRFVSSPPMLLIEILPGRHSKQ